MTNSLRHLVQGEAYQIVFRQLLGVLILALAATLFAGTKGGFSVLAGGLAYGLPNLIFVWRVFRYTGAQQMHKFMAAFFMGETVKLILSGFLVLLVVKYLPVSLLSVIVGFIGAIVSFWIVCMLHFSKKKGVGT